MSARAAAKFGGVRLASTYGQKAKKNVRQRYSHKRFIASFGKQRLQSDARTHGVSSFLAKRKGNMAEAMAPVV